MSISSVCCSEPVSIDAARFTFCVMDICLSVNVCSGVKFIDTLQGCVADQLHEMEVTAKKEWGVTTRKVIPSFVTTGNMKLNL